MVVQKKSIKAGELYQISCHDIQCPDGKNGGQKARSLYQNLCRKKIGLGGYELARTFEGEDLAIDNLDFKEAMVWLPFVILLTLIILIAVFLIKKRRKKLALTK